MPVTITTQPSSQKCLVGASVSFKVVASGSSPFSYQWFKDGISFGPNADTVNLTNLTSADVAIYTVVVTGSDTFTATSNQATLEISNEKGLIPILIGDTGNPSGHVITTSAEAAGFGEAYRAFDGSVASLLPGYTFTKDSWQTPVGIVNGWVQVQFPAAVQIRRYRIYPPATVASAPRDWVFQGSLDGVGWVLIDSQSFVSGWTPGVAKEFTASNPVAYPFYRLTVTLNQSGIGNLALSELLLYNDPLLDVDITLPTAGTRVANNTTVDINSTATVSPGRSVQKVQFYAGSQFLSEVFSFPYNTTWNVSIAGSYQLTAVVVDDLGEQIVSDQVLLVVDSGALYAPPVVSIITPYDGANFKVDTGVAVPIAYNAVSLGSVITAVNILINNVSVATLTQAKGTFYWRPTSGSYTLKVAATDANSSTTTTVAQTITIDSSGSKPFYGQTARVTDDFFSDPAPNPATYVWKFWDKSTKVSVDSTVQKIISRADAAFSAEVVDAYGRHQINISSSIPVDMPPQISSTRANQSQQILPYFATLTVNVLGGGPVPVFVWRDSQYNILAISDPNVDIVSFTFVHKVTTPDEKIYLTIGANIDWNAQFTVDFTLPGKLNSPPLLAPISTGLRPRAWNKVLDSVLLATTSSLARLIGQPQIDGVTVPPSWSKSLGSFVKNGEARILVRTQFQPSQNGIYLATTTRLEFQYQNGASAVTSQINYDAPGGTLHISNTDVSPVSVANVLADLLVAGRRILLTDVITPGVNYIEFQIVSATSISGGFLVQVIVTDGSGTAITPGNSAFIDFGWTKSAETIDVADTVQVQEGTVNSGDFFAFVGDPAPDSLLSSSVIQAVKVNVIYDGSTQPKSRMYVDVATKDDDGLTCTAALSLPGANSQNTIDGALENLIRTKVITDGIGVGIYPAVANVTDSSPISGFAPITSTAKATIPITDDLFLPPKPVATPPPITAGGSASGSATTVPPPIVPTVPNPITVVGPTLIVSGQTLTFPGVGAPHTGIGQRISINVSLPVISHQLPGYVTVYAGDGVTEVATVRPGEPFSVNSNLPYVVKNLLTFDQQIGIVEVFNPA
jgi:hypothetical protein